MGVGLGGLRDLFLDCFEYRLRHDDLCVVDVSMVREEQQHVLDHPDVGVVGVDTLLEEVVVAFQVLQFVVA